MLRSCDSEYFDKNVFSGELCSEDEANIEYVVDSHESLSDMEHYKVEAVFD